VKTSGAVLIEVLVALVILAAAGVSTLGYLATFLDAQVRLETREAELWRADRLLTATTLLARPELDLRLGARDVGEFWVWVGRPEPDLYRISVTRAATPEEEFLVTVLFRPEEAGDGT
jgi:hypothetical protein